MVRTRIVARREKAHNLQPARIRGIEDGYAVAEHVANVKVAAADHDLDAVWAAAEIAVRQVADAASNAPLRNRSFFRSPSFLRKVGRRCQAGQTFHIFTASECGHVVSR